MTPSLVTTKLNIPPLRKDCVHRHQLYQRLNAGLRKKLTIVSAPAGFGKTTAIIDWLRSRDIPIAWFTVDKGDNDIARFIKYLIAALQKAQVNIEQDDQSIRLVAQPGAENTILPEIINALSEFSKDLILVIDDYHQIESQTVHNLVSAFLEYQPENIHLVIVTRYDPPLPISRLRSRDQLLEIRSKDLRFTKEEMTLFLNEIMNLDLDPKLLQLLETRTEGWIASVQLLALSLQGRTDKQEFVESFSGSHQYIVDYLVDEILVNLSEEVQTFLYQTSILDRLCTPLTNAVVGSNIGKDLLPELERANLFLIPLDDDRLWYRYHHLFVDYLRQRLEEKQPEIIHELHRRAGKWFKSSGYVEEAIEHAFRANDFEFAAAMIEDNTDFFWWRGDHATMQKWLAAIPPEIIKTRPRLSISFAITDLVAGRDEDIETKLQTAERALELSAAQLDKDELLGIIAAIRASRAFLIQGNVPDTIEFSRQALKLLPEANASWRSVVALDSGDAHAVTGNLEAAKQDYSKAVTASKQAGHMYLFTVSSAKLANNFLARGNLHSGAETIHQALDFADERGMLHTPKTALLFTIMADILCEWNRLFEAIEHVEKGIEFGERANNVLTTAWGYRTLAKILFSKGDLSGAQDAVSKLESLSRKANLPSYIQTSLVTWKVRIEIEKGRSDKSRLKFAERLLTKQAADINVDNLSYDGFLQSFSKARLLIAQKKYPEAETHLNQLYQVSKSWGYKNGMIESLILQSITNYSQNEVIKTVAKLENALSLAEPEGYLRLFIDEGEKMTNLLKLLGSDGPFQNYILLILKAINGSSGTEPERIAMPLEEPLSKRELEILRLLITELSVPEIADELMVSANTVRTHTRNIYAKLDVHNRRSAVRKAQELKLV